MGVNLKEKITCISTKIHRAAGQRSSVEKAVVEHGLRKQAAESRMEDALIAKEIVLTTAQQTQNNIGSRISTLVSLALSSVFDHPYEFEVEFVQRRGTTEADLWFKRAGNKLEPLSASGGGPVDIASFALRLAVWSLAQTAPVFLLDEPFRNLSADKHAQAGLLLQELSRRLGVQFIIVSHNVDVITGADRVFRLENGHLKQEG